MSCDWDAFDTIEGISVSFISDTDTGLDPLLEVASQKLKPPKTKKLLIAPTEDPLAIVDEELKRARSTGEVDLHQIDLGEIPRCVMQFTHPITHLVLAKNRIVELPDGLFIQFQGLTYFDCQSNLLTKVSRYLFTLPHLTHLLLDYNKIEELPLEEVLLPSIVDIGIEWNNLRHFPLPLCSCPTLRNLYLSENEHMFASHVPSLDAFTNTVQGRKESLTIKLDNRPRVVGALSTLEPRTDHRIVVQWNKIYPDAVLLPGDTQPFLYLGSVRTAQCASVYQDCNIRFVLTAAKEVEPMIMEGMEHLALNIDDSPDEDISAVFEECNRFISKAYSHVPPAGILIHCFAGRSRSVTIAVAYIMRCRRMSLREALNLVKRYRPSAQPNEGFMKKLEEYEKSLSIVSKTGPSMQSSSHGLSTSSKKEPAKTHPSKVPSHAIPHTDSSSKEMTGNFTSAGALCPHHVAHEAH